MTGRRTKKYMSEDSVYQTIGSRRAIRENKSERTRVAMGAVIAAIVLMGVMASLWFGWRINHDRGRLTRLRQDFSRESELNRELIARRDSLLAKKTITRKAAVLGLFPPTKKQIRKP